jgi:hypothetical protein
MTPEPPRKPLREIWLPINLDWGARVLDAEGRWFATLDDPRSKAAEFVPCEEPEQDMRKAFRVFRPRKNR